MNTQDEKPMFANDKKKRQSTDINSYIRIGGMSLKRNYSPEWQPTSSLVKTLSQRMMFQYRSIGSSDMIAKS
jgi:hypothetical protein